MGLERAWWQEWCAKEPRALGGWAECRNALFAFSTGYLGWQGGWAGAVFAFMWCAMGLVTVSALQRTRDLVTAGGGLPPGTPETPTAVSERTTP